MIAYEGKEPYVFASYSHKDTDRVLRLITLLKQKMCRIWYDDGLTPGESWNDDIARHLVGCSQFLVFISPHSVVSKYVLSEINYALAKNKNILPVILSKTTLPPGLEMMLSTIQFLDVSDIDDVNKSVGMIAESLNASVFSVAKAPFLEDLGYAFYMHTRDVDRKNTGKCCAATVFCRDEHENEVELFDLQRLGAYDASYNLSSVEPVKDYFYTGKIQGIYQINIVGRFSLEYPLYGPDVDVLLIFILRIPRHGAPTLKLVDYQYVNAFASLDYEDEEDPDTLGEKGWSTQIKEYLEKILCK